MHYQSILNKFKLLGMVALFATAMMLCSCSKESQIVGKWKITKAPSDWSESDKGETWTFKEGGSCTLFVSGVDLDGDWSVSKDNLTIDLEKYEGVKITGEFTIDELKSKTMSLSGNWNAKTEGGESRKIKANYEFEKK